MNDQTYQYGSGEAADRGWKLQKPLPPMTTDLGPLSVAVSLTAWAVSDAKSRAPATGLVTVPTSPFPRPDMKPLTPPSVFTPSTVEVITLVSPPMIPSKRDKGCGNLAKDKSKSIYLKANPSISCTWQGRHRSILSTSWQATGRPIKMGR